MKKILFVLLMLIFVNNAFAAEMTVDELCQKIEHAVDQINDMSHHYVLQYRPKDADVSQTIKLIESTVWYKKPDRAKEDSMTLYLEEPQRHVYIMKLEGDNYNSYEIKDDGTIEKTPYPADDWKTSGLTPDTLYLKMKYYIDKGNASTVEFDGDRNVYVVRFDAKDQATFEVSGDFWLPLKQTVIDGDNIVETAWSDVNINPGLPDEMFDLPAEN